MIKNGRGVTIRALADEVFSIRIGTLRDRLHATKGSETVYWLFRLSCQSRYRVTDPTSNPFHNVSCSLQKLATIRATQPPFHCFQPEPPSFHPLSLPRRRFTPLFFSLYLSLPSPRFLFFSVFNLLLLLLLPPFV